MRCRQTILTLLLILPILSQAIPAKNLAQGLTAGKIIAKIECLRDKFESYSLFLPNDYHKQPQKEWPILFTFDPGGRGRIALDHFQAAADRYGFIIVCPLNSRNGPLRSVVKAMQSVWQDVIRRFRINRKRIYASGFSGGARVATFFSQVIQHPVQGIIGCGAGLSAAIKPDQLQGPLYYGLVGFSDFNYHEMHNLDLTLDSHSITHHFHYFQGNHQWPARELCTIAWEWMELQAKDKGISSLPPGKIQVIYAQHLSRIKEREVSGDIFFAAHEYRSLAALAAKWMDVTAINEKIKNLEESSAFKKFKIDEIDRMTKENLYIRKAMGAFSYINKSSPNEVRVQRMGQGMGLARLKALAKKKDPFVHSFGRRILYNIANHAETEAKNKTEKGDYDRALLFIKLGIAAGKEHYYYSSLLYNMARIYAGKKKVKKTIKILDQVKKIRPLDAKFIKSDPLMKKLLSEPLFRQYMNSLLKKKEEEKSLL